MMQDMNCTIAAKPPLLDDVLFLDGISRSGKKLNCRLLSQFDGIEHFNYISVLENTCYLHHLGQISAEAASRFVRLNVDEASYERMIGRRLNTRPSDESSILRSANPDEYSRRVQAPDGADAVEAFRATGRTLLYHTHSVLPFVSVLFEAFPKLRFIHVGRNPIDIAADWLSRGWGERWNDDPLAFSTPAESNGHKVPWFAAYWPDDYIASTPAERCILGVMTLQKMERDAISYLGPAQRDQVLQYRLEHLLTDPQQVIDAISTFTGRQAGAGMSTYLESEKLPNPSLLERRNEFLSALAADARRNLVEQLVEAGRQYDTETQNPGTLPH